MKAEQIEAEFRDKGIVRGGLLLLPTKAAIELVHRCRKENLNILGIEGFIIEENVTQPLIEHSIDFTNELNLKRQLTSGDSYKIAEDFLKIRIDNDLFFEIVID